MLVIANSKIMLKDNRTEQVQDQMTLPTSLLSSNQTKLWSQMILEMQTRAGIKHTMITHNM